LWNCLFVYCKCGIMLKLYEEYMRLNVIDDKNLHKVGIGFTIAGLVETKNGWPWPNVSDRMGGLNIC